MCLTFGQLSKKTWFKSLPSFNGIVTKRGISLRDVSMQTWLFLFFLQPCGHVSLFSCVCVCACAWLIFQSSAAYTNSVHGASCLIGCPCFSYWLFTNLWFFTAPQDFNWDIFYYYRWLYWCSTGCKNKISHFGVFKPPQVPFELYYCVCLTFLTWFHVLICSFITFPFEDHKQQRLKGQIMSVSSPALRRCDYYSYHNWNMNVI